MTLDMTTEAKIKVLVVDDAAFMRRAVADILSSDEHIEVIETARDGLDGLAKVTALRPDVITLDIDMPRMDGLTTIRHLMIEAPVPIVVLSSLAGDGAITFEALRLGVVDFVPKPSGAVSADIGQARQNLLDRVKMASAVNMRNIRRVQLLPTPLEPIESVCGQASLDYLVTLGTTLGGPNTVIRLISKLPPDLPTAVVVVQEIAPKVIDAFVQKFDEQVPWKVAVGRGGEVLQAGTCYLSPLGAGVEIGTNEEGLPCLVAKGPCNEPLNALFASAANVFHQNTVGVLLTGTGNDGANGLAQIQNASGVSMAQAVDTCVYPNLTDNAISLGVADVILEEPQLPEAITALMA
jgi:two-component system, chemotaxis family, protein-glutamate methylesterase/glutaminase